MITRISFSLLALLLISCSEGDKKPIASQKYAYSLNDAETIELAREFESALFQDYIGVLTDSLDVVGMVKNILDTTDLNGREQRLLTQLVKERRSMYNPADYNYVNRENIQYLNHHIYDDRVAITFRLLDAHGLNYLKLYISNSLNSLEVIDFYNYANGQNYSTILTEIVIASSHSGSNPNSRVAQNIDKMYNVSQYVEMGAPDQAIKAMERLPKRIRQQSFLKAYALQIIRKMPTEQAIEVLENTELDLSGMEIIKMEIYASLGKFDKALATIDILDERVGGDPFLNYTRSTIYTIKGDAEKALHYLNQTPIMYRADGDTYEVKIAALINAGKYEEALAEIETYSTRYDILKKSIVEWVNGIYPEFAQSKAFQEYAR